MLFLVAFFKDFTKLSPVLITTHKLSRQANFYILVGLSLVHIGAL